MEKYERDFHLYRSRRTLQTRQNIVSYTNSVFVLDKEQTLVVKILGYQSLAHYQ